MPNNSMKEKKNSNKKSEEISFEVRIPPDQDEQSIHQEKIIRIESKVGKTDSKKTSDATEGEATNLELFSSGKQNIQELLEGILLDVDDEEKGIIIEGLDFIEFFFHQTEDDPLKASKISRHADHSPGSIYPQERPIRLKKIQRILSKFGKVYPEYGMIRIHKESHFFEVDVRGEFVTMYTYQEPNLPVSICLEPNEDVDHLPKSLALRAEELILIAKVVSLALDLIPSEVQEEINNYLQKGILGNHVGYNLRVVEALRDIEQLEETSSKTKAEQITGKTEKEEQAQEIDKKTKIELLAPNSLTEYFWRRRKRPPLELE
ncbi:MAG: hypothetical protein GF308_08770 [Candidatus Heimdallarchaeota archaeon]|nr:hypothetical protein [Candidatus Heimdallarchaeota archaeon]